MNLKIDPDTRARLYLLHCQGLKQTVIARRFGVTQACVSRNLQKYKLAAQKYRQLTIFDL